MSQVTNEDMRTLESVLSELRSIRIALLVIGMGSLEQKLLTIEERVRAVAKANCPPFQIDATTPPFVVAA